MGGKSKTRLVRIVSFIILLIMMDQLIGHTMRYYYFRQKTGQMHSMNYVCNECQSELVIVGNSRAQHHFISSVFADSLNVSCYNAGLDGGHSILLSAALIQIMTERYSPKIILLEFSPEGLAKSKRNLYERLAVLSPYYLDYKSIRGIILLKSQFEKLKHVSAIYPFNSNIIDILRFNRISRYARKNDFQGYVPLLTTMEPLGTPFKAMKIQASTTEIDSNMLSALERILRICRDKKIRLYIVNSPQLQKVEYEYGKLSKAAEVFNETMKKYPAVFIDMLSDSVFTSKYQLFYDNRHLNDSGAGIFSSIIARKIKNDIKKAGIPDGNPALSEWSDSN